MAKDGESLGLRVGIPAIGRSGQMVFSQTELGVIALAAGDAAEQAVIAHLQGDAAPQAHEAGEAAKNAAMLAVLSVWRTK